MDDTTRAILAQNLRAARQAKGLTQTELADLIGVSRSDVSEIEGAHPSINPTLERLQRLATALDTTPGALLSE